MAEGKSKWARDLLVIPLVVALAGAVFAYVIPKLSEKRSELSYSLDGPTSYVNQQAVGNITIQVNGASTSRLFAYKVRLWNSGGISLRDLPVRFTFESQNESFLIFNVNHETTPRYEFGKIDELGSDARSKRYVYQLLNPKDCDIVTFLTNDDSALNVNSKAEGLSVTKVEANEPRGLLNRLSSIGVAVGALLASFASLFIKLLSDRRGTYFIEKEEPPAEKPASA
jgi:hypothetical protein